MQINRSNVAFSSRINFVPYEVFSDRVNPNDAKFVSCSSPEPCYAEGDRFYSVQLRSCTGGGIVKPKEKVAGFHIFDSRKNCENVDKNIEILFLKNSDAERGLIIGGKDLPQAEYSLLQFSKIKEKLLEKLKSVSIFQTHSYADSETNYHYSAEDDEWTINTQYSVLPGHPKVQDVVSIETLKKAFDYIHIDEGDELFIMDLPIKKEDAPEFFESIE